MKNIKNFDQFINESSGDLPEYALVIRDEISKLKKGPEGGSIDIGKTFGKDVSQTDIKNLLQEYPDAEVYYKNGRTLLKLKDKNWKQFNENHEDWESKYQEWLKLRAKSEDEDGEKLCYCGHTKMCDCGDPDIETFIDSCKRGDIILGDPNNGWKTGEIDDFDELSK